jgi:hypothetical protein
VIRTCRTLPNTHETCVSSIFTGFSQDFAAEVLSVTIEGFPQQKIAEC